MFYSTFEQIGLPDEEILTIATLLVGFDIASMVLIGTIRLEVTVRDRLLMVKIIIVNAISPYNVIMGESWIHSMKGIPSTVH